MKNRLLPAIATALIVLCSAPRVISAGTNLAGSATSPAATNAETALIEDVNAVVSRVNSKIQLKKENLTEADVADNLREFDDLIAKHKDAPPTALAQALLRKAQLYLQVLNDPEKALPIFKQIKKDYPTVEINGNTDQVISGLEEMVGKKKIRDALVPGRQFPDFEEKDINGKPLAISNYKGKVVLVDFWATWCMPCVLEMPKIQEAYKKYHDKGFEVVGVSLDQDKEHLEQFLKQKGIPWPQFFDGQGWTNKLAVKYGVEQTPTGYLLDRTGKIIGKPTPQDDLDSEVAQALAAK